MAEKEKRLVNHNFRTTESEAAIMRKKMDALGIKNESAYMRALALNGYILCVVANVGNNESACGSDFDGEVAVDVGRGACCGALCEHTCADKRFTLGIGDRTAHGNRLLGLYAEADEQSHHKK